MYKYKYYGECPRCGFKAERHEKTIYRFCLASGCGAFLHIPSFYDDDDIAIYYWRDERWAQHEYTRVGYERLARKIIEEVSNAI